ncbi:MAG TPA: hypothetical protein PLT00_02185 [Verrucomicrobiota bacterium]|jgi:tetratricopeptide (TPR) repeat protein|nr:tetratricopeptide repeat protein [Verrucomicrobiota bacterium]OQB88726.1 MAG: bacteriophage N4 adsorption protein B [Verrucomicrobia bacterium ADurb.Bin118]HPY29725.1 hypothetical protein [Verrucomicrobiota bacterium]HQB15504.1 hypothetical protein [Verrucomicrobiota bacterium]
MATATTLNQSEIAQLMQTIEMFELITQTQSQDYQSLEILKEAYLKLGREKEVVETAKRLAQAYVQLGQLSSAILEYETILQRNPDDAETQAALREIEAQATHLAAEPALAAEAATILKPAPHPAADQALPADVNDGRAAMFKLFVDSKTISADDFETHWPAPDLSATPREVAAPFIQLLADKAILTVDHALNLLTNRTRLGYVPLEKYDLDLELARSFPAAPCRRWCVLPFDRMSKSVLVATANPFNQQAAADLAAATPHRVLWYLAPPAEIVKNLRKAFR